MFQPGFNMQSCIHKNDTIHKNFTYYRYMRMSNTQQSYEYTGIRLFNKLLECFNISLQHFKIFAERFLKTKSFYSIEECDLADMTSL